MAFPLRVKKEDQRFPIRLKDSKSRMNFASEIFKEDCVLNIFSRVNK